MLTPFEICLTACEWVEEKRGAATARRARKKTDQKAIWTFLSQGAVGGAFTYFSLLVFIILLYREIYDPLVPLLFLTFFLLCGLVFGAATGLFVWLPERLFKRRFTFVARTAFAMAGTSLLTIAFLYLTDARDYESALSWRLGLICGVGLTVGLATGSLVRPCRLLVFGAETRYADRNPASWLSIPFGFLLRAASVLGLFEALAAMAVWVGDRIGHRPPSAPPEQLPAIVLVVFYFAASSYFSLRTPRRVFLPPIVILLNVPLAGLIVYLRQIGPLAELILSYILLAIICLWVVYTLGRMSAPESIQRVLVDSWSGAVAPQTVTPGRACQVQP